MKTSISLEPSAVDLLVPHAQAESLKTIRRWNGARSGGLSLGYIARVGRSCYYAETDSLYIDLGTGPSVESREVSPGVVIDLDREGNITGICSRRNTLSGIIMAQLLVR